MNQFHWTYRDPLGRQYIVGIWHGIKTGHLLICLNSNVLIIDFHVLQSKKYSFLINDDMCELQIKEKEDGFKYDLSLSEEQIAQREIQRKQKEKQYFYQKLGAIGIASVFYLTITFLIYLFTH